MTERQSRATQENRAETPAVIVVPGRAAELLSPQKDARWLRGADFRALAAPVPPLDRVLDELGLAPVKAGRAALRLWGQTGHRPQGWVAAADPVFMQAGLERLLLHVPPAQDIDERAFADMLRDLQDALLQERGLQLLAHGAHGYLRGNANFPLAVLPPTAIDRNDPAAFMPEFNAPGASEFFALNSEIEMSLYAHHYNVEREARGQRPLNNLWFWGAGSVDSLAPRDLPVMFTDDPLFKGFAACSESACEPWSGSIEHCIDSARGVFIAVPDFADENALHSFVAELRNAWQSRRLRNLLLLFDDFAVEQQQNWRHLFRIGTAARLEKLLHE